VPFARKKADDHLTIAMKKAGEIGARNLLAQSCLELGRLCKLMKKNRQARTYASEAVNIFRESGASVYRGQAEDLLASFD
jgi:hypothetical protein